MDSPPVARQINRAGLPSRGDSIPNGDFRVRAVFEVDDDSLEFNRRSLNPKLNCAECARRVHTNNIVIRSSIYTGLTEVFPPATTLIPIVPLRICNDEEGRKQE